MGSLILSIYSPLHCGSTIQTHFISKSIGKSRNELKSLPIHSKSFTKNRIFGHSSPSKSQNNIQFASFGSFSRGFNSQSWSSSFHLNGNKMSEMRREYSTDPSLEDSQFMKRKCYGLVSYFISPQNQIFQWEVLSRSSLFLVKANDNPNKRLHVLGPAHVTHPWDFPQYYPESSFKWLKHIRADQVKYSLIVQDEQTGSTLREFELERKSNKSEDLDLVLLSIKKETDFFHWCKENELGPNIVAFCDDPVNEGEEVELVGHIFETNPREGSEGEGDWKLTPTVSKGCINIPNDSRMFISTETPSVMGMCGGPVFIQKGGEKMCIGMIEAMVGSINKGKEEAHEELIKQWESIQHNTVVVSSKLLKSFISKVEEEEQ